MPVSNKIFGNDDMLKKKFLPKINASLKQHLDILNNPKLLKMLFKFYPPYLGAGVHVKILDFDNNHIQVAMSLNKFNKNIVGTQFGGSLYSMTDPFFMFLLMQKLGKKYVVWDKSASIDFIKAGTSAVTANFHISDEEVAIIQQLASDGKAVFRDYQVDVIDNQGEIVAKVHKTLYIRLREFSKSKHQTSRI